MANLYPDSTQIEGEIRPPQDSLHHAGQGPAGRFEVFFLQVLAILDAGDHHREAESYALGDFQEEVLLPFEVVVGQHLGRAADHALRANFLEADRIGIGGSDPIANHLEGVQAVQTELHEAHVFDLQDSEDLSAARIHERPRQQPFGLQNLIRVGVNGGNDSAILHDLAIDRRVFRERRAIAVRGLPTVLNADFQAALLDQEEGEAVGVQDRANDLIDSR